MLNKKIILWCLVIVTTHAVSTQAVAQNYQTRLNGKRLVMAGTSCAGIEFAKDGTTAKWHNELECTVNDKLSSNWRVKWLDADNFLMIQTERNSEKSPPSVSAYQVLSVTGKKVVLKDIWTGWGNLKDNIESYSIK